MQAERTLRKDVEMRLYVAGQASTALEQKLAEVQAAGDQTAEVLTHLQICCLHCWSSPHILYTSQNQICYCAEWGAGKVEPALSTSITQCMYDQHVCSWASLHV